MEAGVAVPVGSDKVVNRGDFSVTLLAMQVDLGSAGFLRLQTLGWGLIAVVQHQVWGVDTVWVTKVEGHASEADVEQGRAREEDRLGNAEADTAADLGRRHQPEVVTDVRRCGNIGTPCFFSCIGSWLLSPGCLSIVMIGEGRPDPLVWDQGSRRKQRKVEIGLMLILLRFLARLGSCTGPGYRFMGGEREEGGGVYHWC